MLEYIFPNQFFLMTNYIFHGQLCVAMFKEKIERYW